MYIKQNVAMTKKYAVSIERLTQRC